MYPLGMPKGSVRAVLAIIIVVFTLAHAIVSDIVIGVTEGVDGGGFTQIHFLLIAGAGAAYGLFRQNAADPPPGLKFDPAGFRRLTLDLDREIEQEKTIADLRASLARVEQGVWTPAATPGGSIGEASLGNPPAAAGVPPQDTPPEEPTLAEAVTIDSPIPEEAKAPAFS